MSDAYAGLDRRMGDERLDRIVADIAGLRAEFAGFRREQDAVNAAMREHVVKATALGDVHEDVYGRVAEAQASHEVRLRSVEDWRVEMRTLGTILKLTFGTSVVAAVVSILALLELVGRFGA